MNTIITDPAALAAMDDEHLAVQVALRQGLIVSGPVNEISWPRGEGMQPAWIKHCRVGEFLDADRILSLLDEIKAHERISWVKISTGGTLTNLSLYDSRGFSIRLNDFRHSSFTTAIVLAWIWLHDFSKEQSDAE